MEKPPIAVESVKNLKAGGKQLLEGILGQELLETQQVFIMVLSPGSEPDDAARRQARAGLEVTFEKTTAYAKKHGVVDDEIDASLEEARKHVRSEKD